MRSEIKFLLFYFCCCNFAYGFDVQNNVTDCVYRTKYDKKYDIVEHVAQECFEFPKDTVECITYNRGKNTTLTAQELGFLCLTDLPLDLKECWRAHHNIQKEMRPLGKECESYQTKLTPPQIEKLRKMRNLEKRLQEGRFNAVLPLVAETGITSEFFVCMVKFFNLNDKFGETYGKCKVLENGITDQKAKIAATRMY